MYMSSLEGDLLIEVVEGALPGIKLSPATIRRYWSREMTAMRARMTSCPLTVDPVKKKVHTLFLLPWRLCNYDYMYNYMCDN